MKFNRVYELTIELSDSEIIVITSPITLDFNIKRNTLASANTAMLQIYNLKESSRKRIFQDRYDFVTYRKVIFKAGYDSDGVDMPIIFIGNLRHAYSTRRGSDWITTIDAFDGGHGIANGFTNKTVPANATHADLIRLMVNDMPNILSPVIGDLGGMNQRGTTLYGNSWKLINSLAGNRSQIYIDLERVYVIKPTECINGDIRIINSASGLLETPKREETILTFRMIFEPHIIIGQTISLDSLDSTYNGLRKVIGVSHDGTISGSVGGEVITSVSLYAGTEALTTL